MPFSIIAAHDKNFGIGINGKIPWYIKQDFQYFKQQTDGKVVIMGLTTYFSLPDKFRPLPNRKNIVLCDDLQKKKVIEDEGGESFSSISEVIDLYKNQDCFIIGGASIYKQFIDISDRLYLTEIDHSFECDTFFPTVDYTKWDLFYKSHEMFDESNSLKYTFNIYKK